MSKSDRAKVGVVFGIMLMLFSAWYLPITIWGWSEFPIYFKIPAFFTVITSSAFVFIVGGAVVQVSYEFLCPGGKCEVEPIEKVLERIK